MDQITLCKKCGKRALAMALENAATATDQRSAECLHWEANCSAPGSLTYH
jgi:hypothetical protein